MALIPVGPILGVQLSIVFLLGGQDAAGFGGVAEHRGVIQAGVKIADDGQVARNSRRQTGPRIFRVEHLKADKFRQRRRMLLALAVY